MKITVIVPCYNAASTIANELQALTAQQYAGAWEVIVVDNGSQDQSIAVAESLDGQLGESGEDVVAGGHARGADEGDALGEEASGDGIVTVFRGSDERDVYSCTPLCKRGAGGG